MSIISQQKALRKIRKQINQTSDGRWLCQQAIKEVFLILFADFQPNFTEKENIKDVLSDFLIQFQQYENKSKQLKVACYHICYNLRAEKEFNCVEVAEAKVIIKYQQQIERYIFPGLIELLNEIYSKNEKNILVDNQKQQLKEGVSMLIKLEKNSLLNQRQIMIFSIFMENIFAFVQKYYQKKHEYLLSEQNVATYLGLAEKEFNLNSEIFYLLKEEGFENQYLKLQRIIYECLLQTYKAEIFSLQKQDSLLILLNTYFSNEKNLTDNEIVCQKIRMIIEQYLIFEDQPQYFQDIQLQFSQYIKQNINQTFNNSILAFEIEKQSDLRRNMVSRLCEIYNSQSFLITKCFKTNTEQGRNGKYSLQLAVLEEFKLLLQKLEETLKFNEKLSNYIDCLIRNILLSGVGNFELVNEIMNEIKNIVSILLPFISNYEYFMIYNIQLQQCYQYKLASRLLSYNIFVADNDIPEMHNIERAILINMEQYCGKERLGTMSIMITEMDEQLKNRRTYYIYDQQLQIILLDLKQWPELSLNDSEVFHQIHERKDEALNYLNQDPNKLFHFSDTLSYVELYWKEVDKTLVVNCVQAAILFLYDQNDNPYTLNEITTKLKLKTEQIEKECRRLVNQKILWNDGNLFYLNDQQIEIEVQTKCIMMDEAIYEKKLEYLGNQIEIDLDWKQVLEAAIMRLLKKYKTLKYEKLIDYISIQFHPIPVRFDKVKPAIEFLLQNEYITRDPSDVNQLSYK